MNSLSDWADRVAEASEAVLREREQRPRATYRLEFRGDSLTFRRAAALIPYLSNLGISHVYASPYRKARRGSLHGYAIVDPESLNPELGTEEDYRAMVDTLHAHGMGHILDIVPNHMEIESGENRWWNDVLENGPSSPYAAFFDVDWKPVKEELTNRILLPILGEPYGQVLESGQIRVELDRGAFSVRVYGRLLPLDPKTYASLLTDRLDELRALLPKDSPHMRELESIITAVEHLPDRNDSTPERMAERLREKEVIKDRLARLAGESEAIADHIQANIVVQNGTVGDRHSFDPLDRLLDAQVFRLSHWRTASDEINYRRFFDVNSLAAVCMESETVFDTCHRIVFDLLVRGDVEGLRIDHVDGLYDPTEYLWRLQWGYWRAMGRETHRRLAESAEAHPIPEWQELEGPYLEKIRQRIGGVDPGAVFSNLGAGGSGVEPAGEAGETGAEERPSLFIVVEKILGPEEPLPSDWPVAGTTGYDFLNSLAGLWVHPPGLRALENLYRRVTEEHLDFHEVEYRSKALILRVAMSSELQMLAHRMNRISERHRLSRDLTLNTLRFCLREILACFSVYRTYIGRGKVTDRDRHFVRAAVGLAKRRNAADSSVAFDFIRDVLLLEQPPGLDEQGQRERDTFVGRFQQVTSPVMAKGVEDTAFYRWFPLAAMNEVGGSPAARPTSIEAFHRENVSRRRKLRYSLLATSTHDTKRSEDLRARLSTISEAPQKWRSAVRRWMRHNRRHGQVLEGRPAPSRNDEYLFYQSLVGIWPLTPPDSAGLRDLVERMQRYMEKATREAKLRTSWVNPDVEYDQAVRTFVAAVLEENHRNRFLPDFTSFVEEIIDPGLFTALSQLLLKLASCGVPDIYQGQELWDFSLVDPDNRRPVDFELRQELLAGLRDALEGSSRLQLARSLAGNPRDPRLKLFVTHEILQLRRNRPELFDSAEYIPLTVEGPACDHVIALARRSSGTGNGSPSGFVALAPRWIYLLTQGRPSSCPVGEKVWKDTRIFVGPLELSVLTDAFTGLRCDLRDGWLYLSDALAGFPVALLSSD